MGLSLFAVPVKGRIRESTDMILSSAGMLIGDRRQLLVRLAPKVSLIRMPAASIAKGIVLGKLSYGITGLDLMTEECLRQSATNVELCCRYDLSLAQLRFMVPKAYTTVNMVSDLRKLTLFSPLRIATKFKRITARYLRSQGFNSFILMDCPKAAEVAAFTFRCHAIMDVVTSNRTADSNLMKVLSGSPVLSTSLCLFRNLNRPSCPELEAKVTFLANRGTFPAF
ncbi:MAG: ATP phosphoribosyltransferase [Candidatus Hodgkinia cicadicola]